MEKLPRVFQPGILVRDAIPVFASAAKVEANRHRHAAPTNLIHAAVESAKVRRVGQGDGFFVAPDIGILGTAIIDHGMGPGRGRRLGLCRHLSEEEGNELQW